MSLHRLFFSNKERLGQEVIVYEIGVILYLYKFYLFIHKIQFMEEIVECTNMYEKMTAVLIKIKTIYPEREKEVNHYLQQMGNIVCGLLVIFSI